MLIISIYNAIAMTCNSFLYLKKVSLYLLLCTRLEAAKRELTSAYMDAHNQFTRRQTSLRTISETVAPSSMVNLTIEQKSQRIAFANSLQKQYKQIEARVNNIGRVLGSMASSVTAAQVVQMKNDVKEISEVSGIIEKRIAKEQVKAMPTAPTGFKKIRLPMRLQLTVINLDDADSH